MRNVQATWPRQTALVIKIMPIAQKRLSFAREKYFLGCCMIAKKCCSLLFPCCPTLYLIISALASQLLCSPRVHRSKPDASMKEQSPDLVKDRRRKVKPSILLHDSRWYDKTQLSGKWVWPSWQNRIARHKKRTSDVCSFVCMHAYGDNLCDQATSSIPPPARTHIIAHMQTILSCKQNFPTIFEMSLGK